MVKDEADIIVSTLAHLYSEGVDGIIIADNGSTDGTRDLVLGQCDASWADERLPQVILVDDPDIAYYQSEKMSRLAAKAAGLGAEWIVPFDADELWWAGPRRLAEVLRSLGPDVKVAEAKLMNYFPTDLDPNEKIPFQRIVHRQPEHQSLPKVAFRWQPGAIIHQGNHGVTLPRPGRVETQLEISHFPYRSEEQFIRKALNGAAAYKAATDLSYDVGAHWRGYGEVYDTGGDQALIDVFNRWFHGATPEDFDPPLVEDPAPFCRWAR